MTETAEQCERCDGKGKLSVVIIEGKRKGQTETFACPDCEGSGLADVAGNAFDPDSYTVVNVDAEQPKVGDTIRYLNRDHQPPIEQEGKIKGRDEPQPGLYAFHLDNEDTVHLCPPMPVKVLKQ